VGVGAAVGVGVAVAVGVATLVGVAVTPGVSVAVGVAVGASSSPSQALAKAAVKPATTRQIKAVRRRLVACTTAVYQGRQRLC